jgi:methylated-DNA-protein-cysteine methyltransferase-like protein
MTEFTMCVIDTIKQIPNGRVMSYGQIASFCGNPRAARQVSRILHGMSQKYLLPWHRVLGGDGSIKLTGLNRQHQIQLLSNEGLKIVNGQVDMNKVKYLP